MTNMIITDQGGSEIIIKDVITYDCIDRVLVVHNVMGQNWFNADEIISAILYKEAENDSNNQR